MKPGLLLSTHSGTGRTFICANLGFLLAQSEKGQNPSRVLLLGLNASTGGDLCMHLGLDECQALPHDPAMWPRLPQVPSFRLQCAYLDLRQFNAPLMQALAEHYDHVLLDGADLGQPGWARLLEICGRGLMIERGDLSGARRMLALARALDAAHFPRQGLLACLSPTDPSQPLPELQGMECLGLPWHAKAVERLAHGLIPAQVDGTSPFARSLAIVARSWKALPAMAARSQPLPPDDIADPSITVNDAPHPVFMAKPQAYDQNPQRIALLRRVLDQVLEDLELKKARPESLAPGVFRQAWEGRLRASLQSRLAQEEAPFLDREGRALAEQELCDQVLGYGPLEAPLADPHVSEIMVNHKSQVYLERNGRLTLSNIQFWDDRQLLSVIERIVAPLGRRIDESSPRVDARLPDGSRVNAIIPPLALKGPCITIRKFPSRRMNMDDLVAKGSLSPQSAEFLKLAVAWKKNIVVSGGTGSGKTTLLNVLSGFIPSGERIITLEDAAELKLDQEHVVSLEGRGEVSIRDLVANCLRMRPDRIVIGECRGGEALDMLQAMNTGHEGSLTTVHANTPRDAVARLETLCLFSGVDLPQKVVRQQIAAAVDLIVQISRLRDGSRRVTHVTEVLGMEGEVVVLQDLFVFRPTGAGPEGQVLGAFEPTGVVPRCVLQAREAGLKADADLFSMESKVGSVF
jgi:pilus assembly protein CpaF